MIETIIDLTKLNLVSTRSITITVPTLQVVFLQTANLATWEISHNLNKLYPTIYVIDNDGDQLIGKVEPIDNNNLLFKLNFPKSGTAYLS